MKLQSQVFAISGTFTFPTGVSAAWISAVAAGGGGGGCTTWSSISEHVGAGAGGGECCHNLPIYDDGTHQIAISVGTGGPGGSSPASNYIGAPGGDSIFSMFRVNGGNGGTGNYLAGDGVHQSNLGSGSAGMGGGPLGYVLTGTMVPNKAGIGGGHSTNGSLGLPSAPKHFGGSGGGGCDANANGSNGAAFTAWSGGPGGANGFNGTFIIGGGGGGGSSAFGIGGSGGTGFQTSPPTSGAVGGGGGGQGGSSNGPGNGANGASGQVIVFWIG